MCRNRECVPAVSVSLRNNFHHNKNENRKRREIFLIWWWVNLPHPTPCFRLSPRSHWHFIGSPPPPEMKKGCNNFNWWDQFVGHPPLPFLTNSCRSHKQWGGVTIVFWPNPVSFCFPSPMGISAIFLSQIWVRQRSPTLAKGQGEKRILQDTQPIFLEGGVDGWWVG